MPGLLVFSARLVIALLLAPLRAAARLLMRSEPEPPPAPPQPPPAPTPPPPRPRRRRAEPTRGQVAAMREAVREAETGGPDSVGADVHVAEPWPGYDDMGLEDVLSRLQTATEVELAVVRAYEREHEARQAVLLATGEAP